MKYIQDHIAYLKDNPEGYWFKRKLYGMGWVPATSKGWLVMALFVVSIIAIVIRAGSLQFSDDAVLTQVVLPSIFATFIFLVICFRTGESLKWQWGIKKQDTIEDIA